MPRCVQLVGEDRFIENNVLRDNDASRGEVIASVPFVLKGITEKNTPCRAGSKLMGGRGI